jgi:hypothetical protein
MAAGVASGVTRRTTERDADRGLSAARFRVGHLLLVDRAGLFGRVLLFEFEVGSRVGVAYVVSHAGSSLSGVTRRRAYSASQRAASLAW